MEYVRLERDDPFSTYIKERIVQSIITDVKNKRESLANCICMCVLLCLLMYSMIIMCEYVGWHIWNSKVAFVIPIINRSGARADNCPKILQNSQNFAPWSQQSLTAQTIFDLKTVAFQSINYFCKELCLAGKQ